jgi:hypothetical protein
MRNKSRGRHSAYNNNNIFNNESVIRQESSEYSKVQNIPNIRDYVKGGLRESIERHEGMMGIVDENPTYLPIKNNEFPFDLSVGNS